jgi:conjugal transfer pilin signal peptidase TrbI
MAIDPAIPPLTPIGVVDAGATPRLSSRRYRLYAGLVLVFGGLGLFQAISGWKSSHAFLINVSPSLPNWAFVLETRAPPARGSLIFFRPPVSAVLVNNFGTKPQLFGKYVYGVAGDVVSREGRSFFINGRQVAIAKPYSRKGEVLPLGPTGVIPYGCYYAGTPHKDSFDSRYGIIGWICRDRIVGTGTSVL